MNGLESVGHEPIGDDSAAAQLDGEPDDAYQAFRAYLRSPRPREIGPVARARGLTIAAVKAWSREWRWSARATAWEHERRRLRYEVAADTAADMAAEVSDAAHALTMAARARAVRLDPADLSTRDLLDAIRTGVHASAVMAELARDAMAAVPPPAADVAGGEPVELATSEAVDTLRRLMRPGNPATVQAHAARAALQLADQSGQVDENEVRDLAAERLARALAAESPEVQERILAALDGDSGDGGGGGGS